MNGRRRTLGLGPYPVVTLKAARAEALENRRIVQRGDDPVALKHRHSVPTFAESAEEVLKLRRAGWTSPTAERNWRTTFERYLFPRLGDRRVCDIEARDVLEALQPIIDHFPKSVSRVRQRIAVVLKWGRCQRVPRRQSGRVDHGGCFRAPSRGTRIIARFPMRRSHARLPLCASVTLGQARSFCSSSWC